MVIVKLTIKSDVVMIKDLDRQGRLLSKDWREKYIEREKVIVKMENDTIIIKPYKLADLT